MWPLLGAFLVFAALAALRCQDADARTLIASFGFALLGVASGFAAGRRRPVT